MTDVDLGIDTKDLTTNQVAQLEKSVAGLLEMNEREHQIALASANPIQRRGQRLPGDVGHNFGLNSGGEFSNTYPGSRYFSGLFSGGGGGLGTNFGGSYLWTHGIQGSNTLLSKNTRMAHHKMNLCVSAYKGFGVAKNVIDLMANFASEGLTIKHPNKTVERFYQRWAEHVDLQGRVKDMLRYYYKYGNLFTYTTFGIIDKHAYDKMRRARAKINSDGSIPGFSVSDSNDPENDDRIDRAEEESEKPTAEREIPWRYTLLNPFQMELRGSKFFGDSRWVFILDENTASSIEGNRLRYKSSYIDFLDESDINLPPEFAKLSRGLSTKAPDGEINDIKTVELDQTRLWTMHYMKDDHEDWADPLIWPVMADIFYKNKLRQMDISVCDSVINSVTIFKLGNLAEGYVASTEHLSKFAEFLRTPTAAMNMVWNDAISIEQSHPPVEKILNMAKYESVDRDILRGIGVPDTLLGGAVSGNFSTGFLGVRTLLERLEEGRNTVIRWINRQLQLIATVMGHRKLPKVKFGKMSLRDEKAEKQLVLGLLDRNIISIQSVLECFGEDFEIEIERLRDEDKIRDKEGLLIQHGPFTDPMATMTDEEVFSKEEAQNVKLAQMRMQQQRQQKPNVQRPNGRPVGTGKPQENSRDTKPQGMAWLVKYEKAKANVLTQIEAIEKIVSAKILATKGKKTKRSLTKHECKGIEEITFAVASHAGEGLVDLFLIQQVLKEIERVDNVVFANYQTLKTDDMSLEDRKLAMASAIAMRDIGE